VARLSNALLGLAVLCFAVAASWQLELVPGSRVTLPEPVAPGPADSTSTHITGLAAQVLPEETPAALPIFVPAVSLELDQSSIPVALATDPIRPAGAGPPVVADAADRRDETQTPTPGYAVRLVVPSINLDTLVRQGGVVLDRRGRPVWQTLPFVATDRHIANGPNQ